MCVIVAAFNAERTIARALRSALAEPEVSELIVVDDASSDGTAAVVAASDDGSGRLRLLRQAVNRGPAAARNRAIEESSAPFIAVLDADDLILPGRFACLLGDPNWDALADNITFVRGESFSGVLRAGAERRHTALSLSAFVEGNISRPAQPRGELGFIKPLIRRAFLDRHGLRYDERLRLGEDYVLYAQMLAAGARFISTEYCGYLAFERSESLSGRHRTADLAALLCADRELLKLPLLSRGSRSALARHARHLAAKVHHRRILDIRQANGRPAAMLAAAADPAKLPQLIALVLRDKLSRPAVVPGEGEVRYLFG